MSAGNHKLNSTYFFFMKITVKSGCGVRQRSVLGMNVKFRIKAVRQKQTPALFGDLQQSRILTADDHLPLGRDLVDKTPVSLQNIFPVVIIVDVFKINIGDRRMHGIKIKERSVT